MFIDWLSGFNPAVQALFGGTLTWGLTALGAASVFFFTKIEKHTLNMMLGFAAGVMIAASFWSLLAPSIEFSEQWSDSLARPCYRLFTWRPFY